MMFYKEYHPLSISLEDGIMEDLPMEERNNISECIILMQKEAILI